MEGLHRRAPARGVPGTTPMRPTVEKGAADPESKTHSGRAKAPRHCECVTPTPPLYRRTILRPCIIGGRHYEPGEVVYVTADSLRQLIDEFAVDPHERKEVRRLRPADHGGQRGRSRRR